MMRNKPNKGPPGKYRCDYCSSTGTVVVCYFTRNMSPMSASCCKPIQTHFLNVFSSHAHNVLRTASVAYILRKHSVHSKWTGRKPSGRVPIRCIKFQRALTTLDDVPKVDMNRRCFVCPHETLLLLVMSSAQVSTASVVMFTMMQCGC